jgi:PmbA protein
MTTLNYENLSQQILDIAKKKGCDQAESLVQYGNSLSLKAESQNLSEYKVARSHSLGVRVQKDNHIGMSSSESAEPESLEIMVEQALENALVTPKSEIEKIEINNNFDSTKENKDYHPDNSTMEEKIEFALNLEKKVLDGHPFAKAAPYNSLNQVDSTFIVDNTLGTHCLNKVNYFSFFTSALLENKDNQASHYAGANKYTFKELDLNAAVSESLETATDLLTAKPLSSDKYKVCFSTECLSDLWNRFSHIFSADSAMKKTNPFAEKIGQKVADSRLKLSDLPFIEGYPSHSPFDSEGSPTTPIDLIENGELKTFLHNSRTANFFKTKTTGHAARSTGSALSVSPHGFLIENGEATKKDFADEIYIEIIKMDGLGSSANASSGHFSVGISGYFCEQGHRIMAFKGSTLTANFFELLKQVQLIGDTPKTSWQAPFRAPQILFDKQEVSG